MDTDQPIILGSEVIEQQNIVFLPRLKKAIFFDGEHHAMMVDMVPWNELKQRMHTSTIQRSLKICDYSMKVVKDKVVDYFGLEDKKQSKQIDSVTSSPPHEYDDSTALIEAIKKSPKEVIDKVKKPYLRWMFLAIIIISMFMSKNSSIDYYACKLRETIYSFTKDRWYTSGEVANRIRIVKAASANLKLTTSLIAYQLSQPEDTIMINTMQNISVAATEMANETANEVKLAQENLDKIRTEYMTDERPEQRPPEFPQYLWKYVFDSEKGNVEERFAPLRAREPYDTNLMIENRTEESGPIDIEKLPKNRLEEILERLMKVDISVETPYRVLEKDIILAQCVANIDRFGHPNPNDPAKARGPVFSIQLNDKRLAPCYRKSKRLAIATYWSLRRRVEHMMTRGEIRKSKSA